MHNCGDTTYKGRLRNSADNRNICRQDDRYEVTVDRPVNRTHTKLRGAVEGPEVPALPLLPEDQELWVQTDAWTSEV